MIHQQFYLKGIIQGVGFRPFVYRLAMDLDLKGWVQNSSEGVTIAVEGEPETIAEFERRLFVEKPTLSFFQILERLNKPLVFFKDFRILASAEGLTKRALVLPDLATCSDCLKDILDQNNRRYQYPFTNCTYCGPRHSILLNLPYDRFYTSMKKFKMCETCQQEYENPQDRRFHAQPNACPKCGPQLTFCLSPRLSPDLLQARSQNLSPNPSLNSSQIQSPDPMQLAIEAIVSGQIVAIKGIGGFHLVCDATNESSVQTLRDRKHRPHKPFAVMVRDISMAQAYCTLTAKEAEILSSPQAPIVLLPRILGNPHPPAPSPYLGEGFRVRAMNNDATPTLASTVAPENPYLGIMLPYSPLHHLLLQHLPMPIVATSGNRSDEPICIDNEEALDRLGDIADAFLLHDRPIVRPLDDSIVRIVEGKLMLLRRSRGYAPLPLPILLSADPLSIPIILAVGGHLKNTIAFTQDDQVFVSPHIGDLDSVETLQRFEKTIAQSLHLYDLEPQSIVRDAHPNYASSQFADQFDNQFANQFVDQFIEKIPLKDSPKIPPTRSPHLPTIVSIQHHHAHLLACWGEHPVQEPSLGVIWDGTGYGTDGQIWGGEFFELIPQIEGRGVKAVQIRRVAHLRPFPLLGGDRAAREPRRSALGVLYAAFGEEMWDWTHLAPLRTCTAAERKVFQKMLQNQLNVPLTSSMGRLFDGMAALLGLHQTISFEGQGAQALEYLVSPLESLELFPSDYSSISCDPLAIVSRNFDKKLDWNLPLTLDWQPLLQQILINLEQGQSQQVIATLFHQSLVSTIVLMAQKLGHSHIFLGGGCFQNLHLLRQTIAQLRQNNFIPYWPQQIPPNDGGIAFGQTIGLVFNAMDFSL